MFPILRLPMMAMLGAFIVSGCQSTSMDRGNLEPMMRSLNHKSYGYLQIEDPTGTAPVPIVERFEVQPGDCASNKGWSDCRKDRERSELSIASKRVVSGEYWYGWSIYFPEDYPNIYPTKVALGQFHQDKAHPVWMFQNGIGGYALDNQVWGQTNGYYSLITEADLRGKWHQIEIHVNWTQDSQDGFFRVWVNGEQKVDYKGTTTTNNRPYLKYGVYRSFMKRYKNKHGGEDAPGQIVYFANVKRGNSRESIQ